MDSAKNMKQLHAGKLAVYYLAVTLQLWFRAFLQLVFALFLRTGTNCLRETLVLVLLRYECATGSSLHMHETISIEYVVSLILLNIPPFLSC